EQMVKDAEANADADKKRREAVEAKNQAETLIDSTEKSLKEHEDKVSAEDKEAIENAVTELRTAIEGDDADDIAAKTQALAEASMKMGQAIYEAQSSEEEAAAAADAAAHAAADDNVVDADFEEINDEDEKKSA
ncbi:MAG: Hsp70 family protein, partial [Pseudomonadota bacterium]